MSVRLNTHLETPATVPSGVNPSVGSVSHTDPPPAIPVDGLNARKHGHQHVHYHESVPDSTGDSTDDATDCDEDGGEDGDCEINSLNVKLN